MVGASTVHLTGAGSVVLRASQAGNADYLAAPNSDQTVAVRICRKQVDLTACGRRHGLADEDWIHMHASVGERRFYADRGGARARPLRRAPSLLRTLCGLVPGITHARLQCVRTRRYSAATPCSSHD